MRHPTLNARRSVHVLALMTYSCFALILFSPILSRLAAAYIGGEPGPAAQDPLSFMWFLTWIPYALSHHHNPLLTDWILSDSGVNLTWNTAVPFIGLVMGPITLWAGPVVSYNLALIAGMIASAWTAYYAAFRLFKCGFWPALMAGAVYGFSPFTAAHAVGHLHLTAAFTPPLFLLVLHDIFITQRGSAWINAAKLAALALVQYFISTEVLLTVAVFASIGVCVLAASCRHAVTVKRALYAVRTLAGASLIAFPLLAYPLYLTFFGPWQPAHPVHGSTDSYTASLLGFIVPSSAQAVFGSLFLTSAFTGGEWDTYLGLPLIAVLILIGYIKRRERPFRFLFAMFGIIAICSLGPSLHLVGAPSTGIPLPWRSVDLVPIFRDVQTNRFGEYLYLLVGLILALYIADRRTPHDHRAGRVLVSLAAVAFLFPRIPLYPVTPADVPDFFRLPRDTQRIESPVLIIPFATEASSKNRATAMLWQAEARMKFKMPEGYALGQGKGPWPAPTFLSTVLLEIEDKGRAPAVTPALKAQIAAVLAKERIRTVVLGPFEHERETFDFLTEVLGTPAAADGVFVWRTVDWSSANHRRTSDGGTQNAVVRLLPR